MCSPLESIVAALVFAAVLAPFGDALTARRAGRGAGVSERSEHPRLEAYYISVLTGFAVFLVAWTAWQNHREYRAAEAAPVRVDVTGFQWCWAFRYPQSPDRRGVLANCRAGNLPTLVVPTGRPVQLRLTSVTSSTRCGFRSCATRWTSFAPLLDLRQRQARDKAATAGGNAL
ncbi:hypothetical protein [Streptomyces sp. NPDC003710]